MKINALFLGALAQLASAHYIFDTTVRNGSPDPAWRYIRDTTRATKYNPIKFSSNPAVDIRDNSHADGPDIRCNQGAFNNAGRTEVLTVTAGSEVRVRLAYGAAIEHPGPTMFYMSRAPGDNVRAYDGSGDWFKIYQDGVCNQGDFTTTAWCSWGQTTIAARIPAGTPNGEYLLRAEHIGVHRSHVNQPEHYVSCVQVRVTGGGNGTPGPMVRFPGAYRVTDPYANFSVWNGHRSFPFPGPAVWNGAGGGSPPSTPPPTTNPPTSPPPSGGNCAPMWGQCGGEGWSGATCCAQGRCTASNQWYSQCV